MWIQTNLGLNSPSEPYGSHGLARSEAEATAVALSDGVRVVVGLSTLAPERTRVRQQEPGFPLLGCPAHGQMLPVSAHQ